MILMNIYSKCLGEKGGFVNYVIILIMKQELNATDAEF
jgi:hypothetical protein